MSGCGRVTLCFLAMTAVFPVAAAEEVTVPEVKSAIDLSFGVGATSNYVARGITQSDDRPAIQGYVELGLEEWYINAWASTVSFGGTADIELDLSAGWRPSFKAFDFDIGYVQYLYLGDPATSFGEGFVGVNHNVNDVVTLGGKFSFAPNYANSATSASYLEANFDLPLRSEFGVSGALGHQSFDPSFGPGYLTWNIGAYWMPTEETTLDLRYTDTSLTTADCATLMGVGTECGKKVMLSFSLEK